MSLNLSRLRSYLGTYIEIKDYRKTQRDFCIFALRYRKRYLFNCKRSHGIVRSIKVWDKPSETIMYL